MVDFACRWLISSIAGALCKSDLWMFDPPPLPYLPCLLSTYLWLFDPSPSPTQEAASLKPPCGTLKFKLLVDQILMDGFSTAHEPLLCNFPSELGEQGLDFAWPTAGIQDRTGY